MPIDDAAAVDLSSPSSVRRAIREGRFHAFTSEIAPDYAQGNLFIVPEAWADDFARFCDLNSQALPVLGRSRPGSPHIPELAADLDLRTDVGQYMVFRDGVLTDTPETISDIWRDDFVAFVLGCSFSFEEILKRHGLRLRHHEEGEVSAMYVTNRSVVPVGPFCGPLVAMLTLPTVPWRSRSHRFARDDRHRGFEGDLRGARFHRRSRDGIAHILGLWRDGATCRAPRPATAVHHPLQGPYGADGHAGSASGVAPLRSPDFRVLRHRHIGR
jgi:hypothetical protein